MLWTMMKTLDEIWDEKHQILNQIIQNKGSLLNITLREMQIFPKGCRKYSLYELNCSLKKKKFGRA